MLDIEIDMINASEGNFYMIINWPETTPLKKAAVWDLMVEYNDNTRDYWLEGEVIIDPGFTAPEDAD